MPVRPPTAACRGPALRPHGHFHLWPRVRLCVRRGGGGGGGGGAAAAGGGGSGGGGGGGKVTISQLWLVSCAGRWKGGQGGATADTLCWPRGRGTPSDSRLPNDRSGPRVEAALRGCC
jgi:hypothetical protein